MRGLPAALDAAALLTSRAGAPLRADCWPVSGGVADNVSLPFDLVTSCGNRAFTQSLYEAQFVDDPISGQIVM